MRFFCEKLQLERARSDEGSVSASTLVSFLALLLAPPVVQAAPPGVVELDSGAWAVVHAGQLWVCWRQAADCWRRVEFESASPAPVHEHELEPIETELDADFLEDASAPMSGDPGRWRLGFWGPHTLWVELDEQRWRVDLGQQRARVTDDPAPLRLVRPHTSSCGPAGRKPAIVSGRLGWQSADRCGPGQHERTPTCVGPGLARQRRPRALRLNVGLQLSSSQAWTSQDDQVAGQSVASVRERAGFEFSVVAGIGFDLGRAHAHQRAQAALLRRDRVRRLPALVSGSLAPLADAEARSLRAVLCGESPR